MRLWEFDDNRAAPTSLVLEQDFILRVRRLNRIATPHLVANIKVSEVPSDYSGRGSLEDAHRRLEALVMAQKGTMCPMTNGDVFLIWPKSANVNVFPDQALMVLLPNGVGPQDKEKYVFLFDVPTEYTELRERANHYVNASREASSEVDEGSATFLLQTEAARGTLSAWTVNQVERMAKEVDLCPFIRSQSIYEVLPNNSWQQLFDEVFIGVEEVKQKYLPHTDVTHPRHLFLDLCQVFDRSLLEVMTQNFTSVSDMSLSINLSLPTILGVEFAKFAHVVQRPKRAQIGFEIHCGDLLQDFTQTLNAIDTLRQEGFRISLDGITPDMVSFFNFTRLGADFIKINIGKDFATSLKYPTIRQAIMQAPREKIIFFHCDSDLALKAGIEMGVRKFQGFLIDERARQWRKV